MKVLVVEDSAQVVDTIKLCLSIRWPECQVVHTARARDIQRFLEHESPDLVLLDLTLVDSSGLDALQELRRVSSVPVIVVSGQGDEISRVRGLETGADDYIVKPFSHTELLARVNATLRRTSGHRDWATTAVVAGRGVVIDRERRRLEVNGQAVALSSLEWALLSLLMESEGKVVSTQAIAFAVWRSSYVEGSAMRMCIRRLRSKLGDDKRKHKLIRSHRGVGYSFDFTAEPSS